MPLIKKAESQEVFVFMANTNDFTAGVSNLTITTVKIGTTGGSVSEQTRTVTSANHGWYRVNLTAADTDTMSRLVLQVEHPDAVTFREVYDVIDVSIGSLTIATLTAIADYVINRHVDSAVGSGDGDSFTQGEPTIATGIMALVGEVNLNTSTNRRTIYRADGSTVMLQNDLTTGGGNTVPYTGQDIV